MKFVREAPVLAQRLGEAVGARVGMHPGQQDAGNDPAALDRSREAQQFLPLPGDELVADPAREQHVGRQVWLAGPEAVERDVGDVVKARNEPPTSPTPRYAAQLNKGETMHALHRHIAFGQRQQLPADEDDHRRHALCLELVANAILAWNTRYLTAAIDAVRATGPDLVSDDALARLSPVGHAHVNPNGRYRFDTASSPADGRLRPLRERAACDERAVRGPAIIRAGRRDPTLSVCRR